MQSAATPNADSPRLTLLLAALQVELEPLLSLLRPTASVQVAGLLCWLGTLRGCEVCAAVCGAGGEACASALSALLDRWPGARVLLVGLAGALNPELRVGDVVVASQALSWPHEPEPALGQRVPLGATGGTPFLSSGSHRGAGDGFRAVAGCVLSWPELVHDGRLKEQLRERFGADCVDMETGYVARLCAAQDVPFLAVRGISDRADETVEELDRADLALAIWHATMIAAEAVAVKSITRPQPD